MALEAPHHEQRSNIAFKVTLKRIRCLSQCENAKAEKSFDLQLELTLWREHKPEGPQGRIRFTATSVEGGLAYLKLNSIAPLLNPRIEVQMLLV